MIENANNEERVNTVRSRQDCGSLCDARVGCRGFESDGKTCQTLGGSSPTPLVGGHTHGVGWTSCLKNHGIRVMCVVLVMVMVMLTFL